jgi:hypothetical protein
MQQLAFPSWLRVVKYNGLLLLHCSGGAEAIPPVSPVAQRCCQMDEQAAAAALRHGVAHVEVQNLHWRRSSLRLPLPLRHEPRLG